MLNVTVILAPVCASSAGQEVDEIHVLSAHLAH